MLWKGQPQHKERQVGNEKDQRKGPLNTHRGSDLFRRTMNALQEEYEKTYCNEEKMLKVLKRLPEVFLRCRQNGGY